MATDNPTTPTLQTVIAAEVVATANLGARGTLDLRTKYGAWLYCRIGRRAATALTVAPRILVRPAYNNDAMIHPAESMDCVGSIAAVNSTTVSSGGAAAASTVVVASATGLAAGDILCLHSDDTSAARVEFVRVSSMSGTTVTVDAPFKTSHNAADRVTDGAEVFPRMWLPGGCVYEVRSDNGASGQSLVFEAYAEIYASNTITP